MSSEKEVIHNSVDTSTLSQLPVAVMLYDLETIYFLNERAASILKINLKQFKTGKYSFFDFVSKNEQTETNKFLKTVLKTGDLHQQRQIICDKQNTQIVIESQINRVYLNGKPIIQCVFSEANEKQMEPIESETAIELLRKMSNNSYDVIFYFVFENKMELKFISESAESVLGYSTSEIYANQEILRKNLIREKGYESVRTKDEYLKRLKETKENRTRAKFLHKDGSTRVLEISVNSVFGRNNELLGIIGNLRDISTNIETNNLLVETKTKFDLITNNSNDIICFYTYLPYEHYLYVSPNIKKILGYEAESLLKDSSFLEKKLVGANEEFHKSEVILRSLQKKNQPKNQHFSFKLKNASGEEVWLENSLVPITDEKGEIKFFLNILRNITEQKEADIEIENQYNNYRNLLDSSPVAYVIHDNGVCLYVNNALLKLFKMKNKSQMLGKFTLDFFEELDRKRALERMNEIYSGSYKKIKYQNYSLKDVEGNIVEVEIKSVPIKFDNRDCILSLVNNLSEQRQREKEKVKTLITETANKQLQKEIRERQEAERSLTEKTAHLSSIFESSTHLIWTVNDLYQVTSFNQNFARTVKTQHGVEIKLGDKIDELLKRNKKEYIQFWYSKYEVAFKGKKLEFIKEDYVERPLYRKIFINPIFNKKNEVTEISCIANDITDSKIYEQKLINQTGKLSAIFDSSHHYIWTIDKEGKLTSFNKNYYDLVTALYNTKPFLGLVLNRGVLANDKEYTEMLQYHYSKAFLGQATNFEIETRDKDFKSVFLEIFLNPIFENGQVAEVSGIAHNTTEKKHVQQRMEQSLKEKEVLLREVHHRVKNNMQVISSILNLQSSYVSDEYTLSLLKESQNRIKTMAYIHESLYQNKSFTSVNFSEYVHTLVNNIVQSYSYSSEKIKLDLRIDKVTLSLDSSIPAGLIINELITNAIKHAFPGSRHGSITFALRTENNYVFLELKDDGVGFAPGVDFENSHSLGLQLVNTLIDQIDGKVQFRSNQKNGTEVQVSFKM